MKTLTIGGVPEHFNLPWHLAIEEGKFAKKGIDLKWKEFPDGTGAMNKALRDGSIDIAIILTSGIIKDIIDGNPSKIVKVYVQSPLLWGVHLDVNSKFKIGKRTRACHGGYKSLWFGLAIDGDSKCLSTRF